MRKLIEVEGLSRSFGEIRAVRGLDFEVAEGEVLGFLGPNGAGKSTTMKMITGFLEPDAGQIRVNGVSLAVDPVAVKGSIGYLPEGAPLYADMTTLAFLRFAASMRGLSGKQRDRRVAEVIELIDLSTVRQQNLDTLSKGFKRRVGIAQAIIHDPPVLILDEPTDGLDPNQKHEVRQLITSMASRKAIILSTHILEEVEAVCTRAMIIASGVVVADGTPAELSARAPKRDAWIIEPADARDVDSLMDAVKGVAGVEAVEREDGPHRAPVLRVTWASGEAPELLRRCLCDRSVPVAQFYREHGSLDDVFREITGGVGERT